MVAFSVMTVHVAAVDAHSGLMIWITLQTQVQWIGLHTAQVQRPGSKVIHYLKSAALQCLFCFCACTVCDFNRDGACLELSGTS